MRKEKLYQMRKIKGYTQQQIADLMYMDVSNYQRREAGEKSITFDEWEKLAAALAVPLNDIYEVEEKQVFVFKDQAQNNTGISYNYSIPEYLLDDQRAYINKLEEEVALLKNLLESNRKNNRE